MAAAAATTTPRLEGAMCPSSPRDPCHVQELGASTTKEPHQPTEMAALSVLDSAEPPALWDEISVAVRGHAICCNGRRPTSPSRCLASMLQGLFPVLEWGRGYKWVMFRSDFLAGLTLASLGIPQSIGYASLANLDPQYGLYTSVVPPMIYAMMGSSKEIAIGPVAVVSLLISAMTRKLVDPAADSFAYTSLVFTATFFAGFFQATFGFLRLGFLVDLLSHAALVGFMGGAAIVIGLQQLKGLIGTSHFTSNTDVVSVIKAAYEALHLAWHPTNTLLGCSFLVFILLCRFLGRKNRKLFWLPAIAPLVSVTLSTLVVYVTKADKHGIKIIRHVDGGLNPSSAKRLHFDGPFVGEAAKIGLIVAVIALTEAMAVGRSFASARNYHLDGNKEMIAMGCMNIVGSLTSCYAATGSFSRTAVNFSAGCKSAMSNVVMAVTVLAALQLMTKLLYYTPTTILASIILSALPGLINLKAAFVIWEVDKLDFTICITAFLGVLFTSVEIGLLAAVSLSIFKIMLNSIQPVIDNLGKVPGTKIFCSIKQYPMAKEIPKILIIRIGSSYLSFINSSFIRERVKKMVAEGLEEVEDLKAKIHTVIIDMTNVNNIDTSGIKTMEELKRSMDSLGLQMAIVNPGWQVVQKMKLANLHNQIGTNRLFLTITEAIDAFPTPKKDCDSNV